MCYASVTAYWKHPGQFVVLILITIWTGFSSLVSSGSAWYSSLIKYQLIKTRSLKLHFGTIYLFPVFAVALNPNQFYFAFGMFGSISFFDLSTPMSLINREIAHQSCVLIVTNPQHRDVNELFYVNILRYEELAPFFVNFILWHLV